MPKLRSGYERGARHRVVGGFGSGHALYRALAEFLRMLRPALRLVVGEEGRDRAAAARQQAFDQAYAAADPLRLGEPAHHRERREHDAHGNRRLRCEVVSTRLAHQFSHSEEADHHHDRLHAAEQVRQVERESVDAGKRIDADGRDHHAHERSRQALEKRTARQRCDDRKAEHAEREIGHRLEGERETRQRLGEDDEHQQAKQRAHDARPQGNAERFARAALPLHLEAVDHRGGGRIRAGRADENGGNGATVFRADVHGRKQNDRRHRIDRVCERQDERHGDGGRQPRHRATDHAPHEADQRRRNERRSKEHGEYLRDSLHLSLRTTCRRAARRRANIRTSARRRPHPRSQWRRRAGWARRLRKASRPAM